MDPFLNAKKYFFYIKKDVFNKRLFEKNQKKCFYKNFLKMCGHKTEKVVLPGRCGGPEKDLGFS